MINPIFNTIFSAKKKKMDLTADYFIDGNGLPNIKNNIRPNCSTLSNSCDKNSFRKFSNQNGLQTVREQLKNTANDKKLKKNENEEKKLKTFYNEIIKKRFQNKDSFSHLR